MPAEIPTFDALTPASARVWSYLLGYKDAFAVDRAIAATLLQDHPWVRRTAQLTEGFAQLMVETLIGETGIRQIIDLGVGMPVDVNSHIAAHAIAPETKVVYVDHDPLVLAYARALLVSGLDGTCAYVEADIRNLANVLHHSEVTATLDLTQPVVVLLIAVLDFLTDAETTAIIRRYHQALPAGSHLVLTHTTGDCMAADDAASFTRATAALPWTLRSRDQVAAMLGDLPLREPGLARISDLITRLRPGLQPGPLPVYGAVAVT